MPIIAILAVGVLAASAALLLPHGPTPAARPRSGSRLPVAGAGAPACPSPNVTLAVAAIPRAADVAGALRATATADLHASTLVSVQIIALPPGERPNLAALQAGTGLVASTVVTAGSWVPVAGASDSVRASFILPFAALPAGSYPLVALVHAHAVPGCRPEEAGSDMWSAQPLQVSIDLR